MMKMTPRKPESPKKKHPPSSPFPFIGQVYDPSIATPGMRAIMQRTQKTPFSERVYDFERALATYTVFFLFFWGAFIGFSLAGLRISPELINSFSAFLLNIDQGLILLGFLSFFPFDRLITLSLIIGWTSASIYARIKFGQLYYLRAIMYAGIFQMVMTIGLLIIILFPTLITAIMAVPSSFVFVVIFFGIMGFYFAIIPLVFGLPGVFIGMVIQNNVRYRPIIRLVPSFLVSPYRYNLPTSSPKKETTSNHCPFRMKQQSGCRYLGLRASNLSLICDDPNGWLHYCTLYAYLREKIGGETFES